VDRLVLDTALFILQLVWGFDWRQRGCFTLTANTNKTVNKSHVPEIFSPKLNALVMIFVVNLCSHFLPVHRAKNPDRARTSFQNFVELLDRNKTSVKKIPNKLFQKRKLANCRNENTGQIF